MLFVVLWESLGNDAKIQTEAPALLINLLHVSLIQKPLSLHGLFMSHVLYFTILTKFGHKLVNLFFREIAQIKK